MPINWVALIVFVVLFGFITVLGFAARRSKRVAPRMSSPPPSNFASRCRRRHCPPLTKIDALGTPEEARWAMRKVAGAVIEAQYTIATVRPPSGRTQPA